jgi:hypothetical protein
MSEQYHKIPNVFKRLPEKPHTIIWGEFYTPELEALSTLPIWNTQEKIDGTNIRIIWDGNSVEYAGKTDKAQIPPRLAEYLNDKFRTNETEELFEQNFGEKPVTLYGEGFGSKIQSGGDYFPDSDTGQNSFALFDINIDGVWLGQEDVRGIAAALGNIEVAPAAHKNETLSALIATVDYESLNGIPKSRYGLVKPIEGYVARTEPGFLNRSGRRVICKLKHEDFVKLNKELGNG